MKELEKTERGIGDLFTELAGETGTLVRQEVALAQAELTEKATAAGVNVGYLLMGGAVAYAALLAVLAAVIAGLSAFIPVWAAALLTAIAVGAVAAVMISSALAKLKKADLAPRESVESIKEDAKWLKKQIS